MSKANRQKAGVKSASSHMAAELLSGSGMVTFDAFAGGCSSMVETEDTISLKKLSKRDSSTREKAIRELLERSTEENVDTVVSTFGNFAAQFEKIIFDCSPSVRNLSMKLVVKQVNVLKKKGEKDLFKILPYIIFASCDPMNSCATEATNFLNSMFTKEKLDVIVNKMSEKLIEMLQEILVTRDSSLLIPSKLLNNDEEDSPVERKNRLSEQSFGVMVKIMRGEKREEAEKILSHCITNIKKNELSRGILYAVSNAVDPISIISSSSLIDRLISIFSSPDQYQLLPLSTDLILLILSSKEFNLNETQKKKVINAILTFIRRCSVWEWDSMGVRLLPLFSSLCSLVDESARTEFITNWFNALQANGIPTKECILYTGDCIKYVLTLLECPSAEETTEALSMMFFLISQSSSSDPSTLQSLIMWSIPKISEAKQRFFLEEVLRRCREKLPSSLPLLHSLLSLHSPYLLFSWEYLHQSGIESLPIHLLNDAPDDYLLSVNDSIGLLPRIEKSGKESLAPLYSRLFSLLPSSAIQRDQPIEYSPLIADVLTRVDEDGMRRIVDGMEDGDRLKSVEEWMKKEDEDTIKRFYRLIGDEKKAEMEKLLLSTSGSLEFQANLASSSEFSPEFSRTVAIRVIKEYVTQSLDSTKAVYLSPSTRSIIHRLDVPLTLKLISDQVQKSSGVVKVGSFHSMATLFYDLIENGMNLMDEQFFFPHILSILSTVNSELSHYVLLSHYWPTSIDNLPYRPSSSSNLISLIEGMTKTLALFLALYVHRSSEVSPSTLLLPILLFSSTIRLARSSSLSLLSKIEMEDELMDYSSEMIQSGGEVVDPSSILSLLSHSPPTLRPLLLFSLRPLTSFIRSGSLPSENDTPFSALPTQEFTLHLEIARQLYYNRKVDQALRSISSHSQSEESNQELFTLECDSPHFSLSISALTGANQYLREEKKDEGEENEEKETLGDNVMDLLNCGIVTAMNSVDSDSPSSSKWADGRRRLLAAAAIQLAIQMNERKSEEWIDFFLPSITPIVLKMYGEIDLLDGSALARIVNLFVATHPSLVWDESWNGKWDKKSLRYDMEMDQAGVPSTIQTLVVRASSVLEDATDERGEAIVAASRIIGMAASSTVSFSVAAGEDEKGVIVVLPPFMKNLVAKEGWSRCGVLVGCISLLSSSSEEEEKEVEGGVARSVMCDALAPLISKSLTTLVSKTEQKAERIPQRFYTQEPILSSNYFLHWMSHLLRDIFTFFPAVVKMWYTGLPKSASTLVNGFISSSLSSILIDEQITQVMEGNLGEKYKNDQVTLAIRRHANEMMLDYIMEDTRMRMAIKLPNGWPLVAAAVSVEGSIVGVEDGRKWMLQLNSQLHRNASLLSALSSWLSHAGKKVEGAESCTICMQLVDPQTKRLPKARCRTCHNKFHSSCLYKWFESSNQTSCPLCRTDFTAPP